MIYHSNQKHKFSTKDYINPNSSFKKYVKEEVKIEEEPQIKMEEVHRVQLSTEDIQDSSLIHNINRRGKIQKNKDNHSSYKSETKNIPKNFGVLLKKFLCAQTTKNQAIIEFLNNGENKKNFSRQDLQNSSLMNQPHSYQENIFQDFKQYMI